MPLVLGELLAGVLLGPTFLNFWGLYFFAHGASANAGSAESVFKVLAEIGVVLLMFIAVLESQGEKKERGGDRGFCGGNGGGVFRLLRGWLSFPALRLSMRGRGL